MRKSPFVFALLVVLIAAAPPSRKPRKKDGAAVARAFAAISGAWEVRSSVTGEHASDDVCSLLYGRKTKVANERDPTEMVDLFIEPGRFGFGRGRPTRIYPVTVDPTANPPTFDLTLAKNKIIRGIYQYEDGFLTLGFGGDDHRPKAIDPADIHDFVIGYGPRRP